MSRESTSWATRTATLAPGNGEREAAPIGDCVATSATYKGLLMTYSDLIAIECRYRIQELLAEADRNRLARQCFDQRADSRSKHAVRRAAVGFIPPARC